jgi:hypothetical protein
VSIPDPTKKQAHKPEYKPPWPTDEELSAADAEEAGDEAEADAGDNKKGEGKPLRKSPKR